MNHYDCGNMTYPRLRQAVKEAWEAITEEHLEELMNSMHDRCQAVIDTKDEHINF